MKGRIGWLLALPAWPALAAPAQVPDLLNWLLSSLLVIGLLLACAWLLKKSRGIVAQGRLINILGLQAIGGREKLMLVQVGDRQYLLGVTAQRISLLDKLDTPLPSVETRAAAPEFAMQLSRVLGRHDKD